MQVETRAYLLVYSKVLSPEAVAERIGTAATVVASRGGRPCWALGSGLGREAPLWRHLEVLYERLEPLADALGVLCSDEPVASLTIVRAFMPEGQGADLGFWLDRAWIDLLHRTRAFIDVIEGDSTDE